MIRWLACCAMLQAASGCSNFLEYPEPSAERDAVACADGKDNDLDGNTDCDDTDCTGFCHEENQTECSDGRDNDGDGLTDAADPRCWLLSAPKARRCAATAGLDSSENFDVPSWAFIYSFWRRWGVSSAGQVVDSGSHHDAGRRDPLIRFSGNTTDSDSLQDANLGALVRQRPLAGSWQGFELAFNASVPPGALLRVALVPMTLAPSQDAPPTIVDAALLALTLDASRSPPTLALDVGIDDERQHASAALRSSQTLCGGTPCDNRLGSVTLVLDAEGFRAALTFPNGDTAEVRAPAPRSFSLSTSRLVFSGGSAGAEPALLDDLRVNVKPEWPCGIEVPQIPGSSCEFAGGLGAFGRGVSVARGADGAYCSLVAAGPRNADRDRGGLVPAASTLTAWRSPDGDVWTPVSSLETPPVSLPEGAALIGAGIAADRAGWHAAVTYREEGHVRLGFSDGASCQHWGPLSPGPILPNDAEAPSYVISAERHDVYFTRPATDQTNRTLWRVLRAESTSSPELLAELPPEAAQPISVQRAGETDLVLAYPDPASPNGPGGVGLLVANSDLHQWQPVGQAPVLALPPAIDLFDGHGRIAFDDRGVVSAALAWGAEGGFLLYGGTATNGLGSAGGFEPQFAVGTARLIPSNRTFADTPVVPQNTCGDGICGVLEDCTSCEADCACTGPELSSDLFTDGKPWQLVSSDPAPASIRYLAGNPPELSWASGETTWSILPLDRAISGDFELSFDALVAYTDGFYGDCSVYVGLGAAPRDAQDPSDEAAPGAGIFARLDPSVGWYFSTAVIVSNAVSFSGPTVSTVQDEHAGLSLPMDAWSHVVLRREGNTVRTLIPRQDSCGVLENTVTYTGTFGDLPALLVGFGGGAFAGCSRVHSSEGGANSHGTIKNLSLRLLDDPQHCPEAKRRCGAGSEQPTCVDTTASADHCGACNHRCAANEVCSGGACTCNDQPGIVPCAGTCVDSYTSNEHCGGCGNACGEYSQCAFGTCVGRGDCASPFELDPAGGSVFLASSLVGATHDTLCDRDVQDQVIFAWTPEASGTAVIEAHVGATDLDTEVGIAEDSACQEWLACNDDISDVDLGSRVEIPVQAGTSYRIGVGVVRAPLAEGEVAEVQVRFEP